jgi:hypothetical protein
LQAKIGKSGKITSTRLGELLKNDFAVKITDEKFRITTFGVLRFKKRLFRESNQKLAPKLFEPYLVWATLITFLP